LVDHVPAAAQAARTARVSCGVACSGDKPVGAENPVTSSDLQVLVNETAEAVSSQWSDGRAGGRGSAACGRVLIE
jgi:hypothetical protein